MKVLSLTRRKLVFEERPWLVWLVGALFVISGSYVLLTSAETLFGLAFVALGAGLLIGFANTVTCTFDLDSGQFTRATRGLLRNSTIEHPVSEIAGVRVEQVASGKPSKTYRIALVLRSSERVPLTTSYSSGRSDKEAIAKDIREFLDLTDPGEVALPGFGDMFRLMVNPGSVDVTSLYGGAVAEQEAAVNRDPDNVEARRELAVALAMQNRPEEARAHLEAARGIVERQGNSRLAEQFDLMLSKLEAASGRRSRNKR